MSCRLSAKNQSGSSSSEKLHPKSNLARQKAATIVKRNLNRRRLSMLAVLAAPLQTQYHAKDSLTRLGRDKCYLTPAIFRQFFVPGTPTGERQVPVNLSRLYEFCCPHLPEFSVSDPLASCSLSSRSRATPTESTPRTSRLPREHAFAPQCWLSHSPCAVHFLPGRNISVPCHSSRFPKGFRNQARQHISGSSPTKMTGMAIARLQKDVGKTIEDKRKDAA